MYTSDEFVSVSGARLAGVSSTCAPDFVDGPCLDQACPNASWPHPASSDLADPGAVVAETRAELAKATILADLRGTLPGETDDATEARR